VTTLRPQPNDPTDGDLDGDASGPGGPNGLDRIDGPDDDHPHESTDGTSGIDGTGPPDPARQRLLARVRIAAIALWVVAYAGNLAWRGLTVDRPDLILWTVSAVVVFSIGRRSLLSVVVDWLPFAALLMAYDFSRGAAHLLGRPTMWTPQIDVDRWLGGGNIPTVWLQAHLKMAHVPWWEFLVSSTYVSYFLLPYVVAGVLWLRNRHTWRRFVVRYVLLSFIGISGFVLFPAAPPWAAARCTAVQVADHPGNPACLYGKVRPPDNALLGGYLHLSHPSASPYVEQLALRGFLRHGLPIAARAISEGHADANQVAAIPSLHAATSLFIVVFLWPLVRRRWRPLLIAYPLVMAFSLVYSAEHYVFDVLLGWAITAVLTVVVGRWERRRGIGLVAREPVATSARG
jgi:PAP2 superfamily